MHARFCPTQKELPKASPPTPLLNEIEGYVRLGEIIPQLVFITIIGATIAVFFKKKFIDSPGFTRACWILMLFASDVLYSSEVRPVTTLLILVHIGVNSVGLAYWIVLDVKEYTRKSRWPSMELLFETGVWLFMVILSWVEFTTRRLGQNRGYFRVYYSYPIAVVFGSMIANYWTNMRKTSADRLKSELIGKTENAFDDFIGTLTKEPQNDNKTKFNQNLNDLTRLLSILVAQKQETLKIIEQQEARSEAAEFQTSGNSEEVDDTAEALASNIHARRCGNTA